MTSMMDEIKKRIVVLSYQEMIELQKWLRDQANIKMKGEFKVGEQVWFETYRYGRVEGKITKINPKTVGIRCTKTKLKWKVHPSYLNKV